MTDGLFALLRRRMADEQVGADEPVAVAELHKRLLPYHMCRDRLGYATKAEYDVALLRLLADDRRLAVSEPALREAVQAEIRHPEPGLAFLHRFAASEVRLLDAPATSAVGSGPNGDSDLATPGAPRAADPSPAGAGGVCRVCSASMPALDGVRFCPSCGADQVVPTCDGCGAEVEEAWAFCAFCGVRRGTGDA